MTARTDQVLERALTPSEPLGGGAGNSGRHDTAWWDQVKHEMGGES